MRSLGFFWSLIFAGTLVGLPAFGQSTTADNPKSADAQAPVEKPKTEPPAAEKPKTVDPTKVPPVEQFSLTLDKEDGMVLTLEESLKMAIRVATSVLKAQNNAEVTGAQLLQAYGQFLPNLSGGTDYAYNGGKVYYTTANPTLVSAGGRTAAFNVQSDLNIFNGLSDFSNLKSSLLKRDASELTVFRAKQQISLDAAQSFLQVILDNQLVNIAAKNLQESREREKLLQEQTNVGARNLSDLFRQQAQTSQDESSLIVAQNRTRTDQISFLKKLRMDVTKTYHFVEPKAPEAKPLEASQTEDALVKQAMEKRADLRAATNTADATNWDVKARWGGYLPKLDLIGTMSGGGSNLDYQYVNGVNTLPIVQNNLTNQLGNQINYTIGIYLTWNIFDRFITNQNIEEARVSASNSQIDAQDRRIQVAGDVRQAFGDYMTSLQQLRSSKKGLDAAQKAYEVMEGRYEVGGVSFLDLVTAQAVLVQAESARAEALIDFQLQSKSLDFALGDTKVD